MATNGIELEITYLDDHVAALRVSAGNGRFAGSVNESVGHDVWQELARDLEAFPTTIDDRREVALGMGAWFGFGCDSVGRPFVEARLTGDRLSESSRNEAAEFVIPLEVAAIDAFLAAVRQLGVVVGASVRLHAVAD